MKKSIFKLVSTAVALTALASCSDDLGLETPKFAQNADMVATLEPFSNGNATRMVAIDNGGVAGLDGVSWETGEQIRVFTLENLQQDLYEVTSVDGNEGIFKKVEDHSLSGQQYAITMSDAIYGISSSKDDNGEYKPLLTVTLPDHLTPSAVKDKKAQFPVPYWGEVQTVTGNESQTNVQASMRALTAFLRVNLSELPDSTNYIVLTTHGALPYKEGEGFMLADFGSEKLQGFADTKDWWYATKEQSEEYAHRWVVDGYSEPLSGTLNTFLNSKDAQLAIDERLVNKDYIVVDLENLKKSSAKTFYLPIVCGTYKNLHVIAASYVSKKYSYCYAGTELMDYQDQTFVRNTAYYLDMGLVDLGVADIAKINAAIASKSNVEGFTTIFNVDKLVNGDGAKILTKTAGNVVLNITEIQENYQFGKTWGNPLIVTDEVEESEEVKATTKLKGGAAKLNHFVQINMPSVGTKAKDNAYNPFCMLVNEGKRDLIMGTTDGDNANCYYVKIKGSATKFAKTYSLVNAANNTVIDNETHAAVTFTRGYGIVDILNPTKGDVYAYTPSQATSETEIVNALLINTKQATGIRMDNSLVGDLGFIDGTQAVDNRQVFTTGSSAIKNVCNSTEFEERTAKVVSDKDVDVKNPYATPATSSNTAGRVTMRSYWTGAALSAWAIGSGYDRPTVYTVAQLASVGEGIYNPTSDAPGTTNHEVNVDDADPDVNNYNIPAALVRLMWLGGTEYKWIGARVRVEDFSLNGENVELKNINIIEEWDGPNSWIDDPHWCCTTCWKPAINGSQIQLDKNFGLIRSIIQEDVTSASIQNVNLNDVDFQTKLNVSNVGSIVGYVETGNLDMVNNTVGEVKIDVPASHIGGLAGFVLAEKINISRNQVTGKKNNSGFIKGDGMVGGLIGVAETFVEDAAESVIENINNNTVVLNDCVTATKNDYVGGLVGLFDITDATRTNISANYVDIAKITAEKESYAGGVAGALQSDGTGAGNTVVLFENQIVANNITAEKDFAAGLVGNVDVAKGIVGVKDADKNPKTMVTVSDNLKAGNQYAGGLFGKVKLAAGDLEQILSAKVSIENLEATNGFAGGFVGQVLQGVTILGKSLDDLFCNLKNQINVAKMTSLYAAGGVIGNNAQSSKTPVTIITGKKGNYTVETHVNVKSWAKTEGTFAGYDNYKYGTMSNIIGHMQDNLTINEDKSTIDDYKYLTVADNLDKDTKQAIAYYKHNDESHNIPDYTLEEIAEMDASKGQLYWGDENGYVGVRETGTYKIADIIVKGEQLTPTDLPGHNQFKVGEDWVADKSKWQN